jgi:hypothetical protein
MLAATEAAHLVARGDDLEAAHPPPRRRPPNPLRIRSTAIFAGQEDAAAASSPLRPAVPPALRPRLPNGRGWNRHPAADHRPCRPPPRAADGVGHLFDLLFLTPATTPSPCCLPNLLLAASELPPPFPLR